MTKHILSASMLAACAMGAFAADDTMYLVKDNMVVGKYLVDVVDYVTFNLPDDVEDSSILVSVDNVGKNTVTYTVKAQSNTTAYAHNIITADYLDALALSYEGDYFANLEPELQVELMQEILMYDGFLGAGTQTFTQNDYALISNTSTDRFSVFSGTKYYLCAWEIDMNTYEPKETFVYTTFETLPGATTTAAFNCELDEINSYGAQFKFTGDENVLYVRTAYGEKETMDIYATYYGIDFLLNAFGNSWSLAYLQDTGELGEGISNSIWPVYDPGDYVMFARAYDANGDYKDVRVDISAGEPEAEGPKITVFSKTKSEGSVSVNFEISPSNVEEAYVRLMGENAADDRLNLGYTVADLAQGGDATDITNAINTAGEYTYTNNELDEQWYSLFIYAKDKDGVATTLRLNFYPDEDSRWSQEGPVYSAPARKAAPRKVANKKNPTIAKARR